MLAWPLVFIKGLLIGIANVIPGVSGGTFALLLGIYERLINAIRAINAATLGRAAAALTWRSESRKAFRAEWKRIDGTFLLVIGGGVLFSILACSRLIKGLLDSHPAPTLAFFVGLIVPSVAVPYGMMKRRGVMEALYAVVGLQVVVAVSLAGTGGKGGGSPLFTVVCGMLAISAMILPGISGSFLLLVLGEYSNILGAVNRSTSWAKSLLWGEAVTFPGRELITLIAFLVGAVIGLAAFVRLLSLTLRRLHDRTMGFLTGLIVGSLWTLWPFKDYSVEDIRQAPNVWPSALDAGVWWVLVALVAGITVALVVILAGRRGAGASREVVAPKSDS